ncbi:MAG: Type II secretion system protein [Candidatus Collierbacteria bacterium GW2011_GWB1_45_35]|uniref:Type II secretion system protein n=1 Tax=Candidatus Collierbacteria bacterium GW2011_GWB2_45_17 TaxID=1618388 RepID=A0A837IE91_9BACT|nr:MAG: Type II secretion system protein [Microgenomates group bacterium GW2011_GWC1_44_23]KKT95398.1 MAG: Type II secretion system protein [Candidatus Collierbacteria bacterium GW2011_GWA1_45_15]KKU00048.1 MAG: Type II secretion system protein [Candidatus Collierbacteria bacterium GW2011_GWB2_45_17]KKU05147.1 MAG: Type II secretion system protein [Candidatus Collierbacteria bacterium GW2011_GWB1_45_35]KKU08424.1 MAG: Type II secretion system protein [Candidatus Collierbacteria bacterium GW2011
MKTFQYKVRDRQGTASSGVLDAVDDKQAANVLRSKGLLITALYESDQLNLEAFMGRFSKPKVEEITNFTRQMATMIGSGLPLIEALKILKNQAGTSLKPVIDKILTEVEGGSTLGDAVANSGGGFSSVYVAMIRAGESAGVLDQVMGKLADTLDKQREFKSKTKGAMVYPIIISVAMVVIAGIMMVFVVPKLTAMYKDFGAELPGPTKALMAVSDFAVNYWYAVLLVVAVCMFFFSNWSKTEVGGLIMEQLTFKIPIWGKLKKDVILTEFARTISVLLAAGIPILDALNIVANTLGSKVYSSGIRQAAVYVEKGISLAEAITRLEMFPPILSQMISVGEETGKLDSVLSKLAVFYESESETKIKALTTAIEPLIMILMGIGVGFLVIAVIMPIYNLTSQF